MFKAPHHFVRYSATMLMQLCRRFIVALICMQPCVLAAQQTTESTLRAELAAATTDSAHARISGALAWELKFIKNEEALSLAREEIRLAPEDPLRLADGYRIIGLILVTENKPEEGLENYARAIDNARKAKSAFYEASCNSLMAGMYQDLGDYDRSLQYYLEGLKVAEQGHNGRMTATILNNIATIYDATGHEQAKALSYFKRALAQAKEMGSYPFAGMISSSIAGEYMNMGKKDSAMLMMDSALVLAERGGGRGYEYASTLGGLGDIYASLQKPLLAESCLKESVHLMDSLKRPMNVFNPITSLSTLYLKQGRITKAKALADRMLAESKKYGAKRYIREAYKLLSDIAHSNKQDALALEYMQQYSSWNDSVFNETREQSMANTQSRAALAQKEMEVKYDTKQKEQENKLLKTHNNTLRLSVAGTIVGLLLLSLSLLLIWRTSKQKERINKELEEKNKLIEQQSKEKDMLMMEIHHRVKNNLQIVSSLLNLQANAVSDATAKDALKASHNRVKSIALIHQKLYMQEEMTAISLEEYVMQLCSNLKIVFEVPQVEIKCSVSPPDLKLDMEQSIPLGLILNELVTNSIKYGLMNRDGGCINIYLSDDEKGGCILDFSDNGVGMPADFDLKATATLGMRMIQELTRQLRGTLTYAPSIGVNFRIVFPRQQV